jgi:O-acetyl-ADP-ribose deacetylase (regulator of RNase III)
LDFPDLTCVVGWSGVIIVRFEYRDRIIDVVRGDITKIEVDAIVNAANEGLLGGGGVDGAIHRAGGPEIMEQCRKIGGCPTGEAVITGAGRLPARYVIHTVGPVWRGGRANERKLLGSAYEKSLRLAGDHDVKSVAFPSISTGVYGYPIAEAVGVAIGAVLDRIDLGTALERIVFVLFSAGDYDTYIARMKEMLAERS